VARAIWDARQMGKMARERRLSARGFELLLKALVARLLEAGHSVEAATASEEAAIGAYLDGDRV
jgi:hypothetical protein